MLLQDAVGKERRPLSWVVDDQRVYKAEKTSQRDLRNESRIQATELRNPDHV
jgi:NADH-quinone oxidoreductase subunit B